MKHILSILVRNRPGVMSHVSGLFTRRGFNIDSIAVGVTDNPEVSSITIVLKGEDSAPEQFKGQLLKLADVIEVKILPYNASLIRELLLVRVNATSRERSEIKGIAEVFGATIAEITEKSMLIELNGENRRIVGIMKMLAPFGISDIARTGQIALAYEEEGNV